MMTLDTHVHFWRFDPVRDAWITPDMAVLRRDYLPGDLAPVFRENGVAGCIAVQADQSETETRFLLGLGELHPDLVRGVVGWVDLRARDIADRLDYWKTFPRLRGFRHILQGEKPAFMLQPEFVHGLKALGNAGFTYDILVFPRHLNAVQRLVKILDNQPFVIDHMAKPYLKKGLIRQWEKDMRTLARHPHVWCKVSGLVTEADWQHWTYGQVAPYLEVVFEAFGAERVLYGSDHPVCLLAADYRRQKGLLEQYVKKLSSAEQQAFWGGNALAFYG